jgi:hypothetical protein
MASTISITLPDGADVSAVVAGLQLPAGSSVYASVASDAEFHVAEDGDAPQEGPAPVPDPVPTESVE